MKEVKSKTASRFPRRLIKALADEVAKTVVQRLPRLIPRRTKRKINYKKKSLENSFFLDTSAIIDARIFDVILLGVVRGAFVILDSILLELKHVADSQDSVKRLRGRKGLELLEKLKKTKGVKVHVISDTHEKVEVDERLIRTAKMYKGRIITCDYNLEKKAAINGVLAINVNTLANALKVTAVPGEALHIKILHKGKDSSQGVGYLDDGTMIVVENASLDLGKEVDVIVSRVIQTTAGRILFAKKI
ncbi:MAG: TRAM domain-containing protein [Patescibacteria group bacterium]